MWQTLKSIIHDGVTCLDGKTYDPLKIIGYPSAVTTILIYLSGAVVQLVEKGTMDFMAFGAGFTGICTGLCALAAGVAVKSHTEPQE